MSHRGGAPPHILRRKIDAWIAVQHLYMPALATIRMCDAEADDHNSDPTEDVSLYLPSALAHTPSHPCTLPLSCLEVPVVPCNVCLREMEWELRNAQASDALAELRDGLRLCSYLYIDKDRFQRGQRHNTCSRGIIDRTVVKIAAAASKYRAARLAIKGLAPVLDKVGWEDAYPLLASEDIRAMGEADPSVHVRRGPAQGRHRGSWIWTRLGDLEYMDDLLQDNLRMEWCKGKARADQWQEEVRLLLEEMERVDRFFNYKAAEWGRHGLAVCSSGTYNDRATAEGRRAYAAEQAAMYSAMRRRATHLWLHVPTFVALGYGLIVPEDVETAEKGDDDAEDKEYCLSNGFREMPAMSGIGVRICQPAGGKIGAEAGKSERNWEVPTPKGRAEAMFAKSSSKLMACSRTLSDLIRECPSIELGPKRSAKSNAEQLEAITHGAGSYYIACETRSALFNLLAVPSATSKPSSTVLLQTSPNQDA
ncbi:hypothetical protein B0H34DRAFT_674528 [Crassisporium funariophilum]|nr:hypothetical protein B0H34DRAFT_674528 [Crassisporium funariophilum]